MRQRGKTGVLLGLVGALLAGAGGCGSMPRDAVPADLALSGRLVEPGAPDLRPSIDPGTIEQLQETIIRQVRWEEPADDGPRQPYNVLALSGGGMYGAFGVGILCGWTAAGTRPEFDVVTGISTGALISTYAFLGPEYDEPMRRYFTTVESSDVFECRRLIELLRSDSLTSSAPLKRLIDSAMNEELLRRVAAEHAKGRRLYVGTTNLDTRRLVIWDMGAIASSGRPDALELYRKVILASASVPVFFPPVYVDVEVDGETFTEMHVDGGVSTEVFFRPFMFRAGGRPDRTIPGSNLYVVCDGKLYADPAEPRGNVLSIAAGSITALLHAQTRENLFRLFALTLVSGMRFHVTAVPQSARVNPDSLHFDPAEMRALYEMGYLMAKSGTAWRRTPPGVEDGEGEVPRGGTTFTAR